MRRIDRYVIREMLVPFFAGTFIVALLFQANSYIAIAKNLNLDAVPVLARVQWLLYTLPYQLKFTFPTGIALAAALSVGRMARESEITAIRAAGTSVRRVMRPVVIFGLLAGLVNFGIVDRLIPICGQKARDLQNKNALLSLTSTRRYFKANAFVHFEKYAASFGAMRRTPDDQLVIENVLLIERNGPDVVSIVTAPTGIYDGGLWTFRNARPTRCRGWTSRRSRPGAEDRPDDRPKPAVRGQLRRHGRWRAGGIEVGGVGLRHRLGEKDA